MNLLMQNKKKLNYLTGLKKYEILKDVKYLTDKERKATRLKLRK